jgi:hypothetical protein
VIAQKALETLVARLPILRKISTDFSDQKQKFGENVIVHVVSPAAAAEFSSSTGYVVSERTQNDVAVPMDHHIHHTYGVGVQEASSSRVDLINRFATTAAYSLGANIVSALCALVKKANFANETVIALGTGGDGFNRKGVIKVGTALGKRFVAPFDRFMLLNSDYYGSLCNDITIVGGMNNPGQKTIQSGVLPDVHGFEVSEYVSLPDNSQNLVGFAGTVDSLALATRIPDDPGQGASNCSITIATEPQTGLSIQVREWYNPDMAQYRRSYTLMFGVAKAQTAALQRIVSKANS